VYVNILGLPFHTSSGQFAFTRGNCIPLTVEMPSASNNSLSFKAEVVGSLNERQIGPADNKRTSCRLDGTRISTTAISNSETQRTISQSSFALTERANHHTEPLPLLQESGERTTLSLCGANGWGETTQKAPNPRETCENAHFRAPSHSSPLPSLLLLESSCSTMGTSCSSFRRFGLQEPNDDLGSKPLMQSLNIGQSSIRIEAANSS
jgi:hypothetical protein